MSHASAKKSKTIVYASYGVGLCCAVLLMLDVTWLNIIFQPHRPGGGSVSSTSDPMVKKLRQGVVLLLAKDCRGREVSSGTGFIVKAGYIATNKHVIEKGLDCEEFQVIDFRGRSYSATLEAFHPEGEGPNDLAVLKISQTSLPPLALDLSQDYHSKFDGQEVFTIGYPKPGIASSRSKASISGNGTIAQFDSNNRLFVTSGLALNSGNSGGPVILKSTKQVIGIAVAKTDPNVAEATAFFIPIANLVALCEEKLDIEL